MTPSLLRVWPPLPPWIHLSPPRRELPYPLGLPPCVLFARARSGIFHGVRALGLEGHTVLVPAYNHGSEVESLLRAGVHCRFYDAGEKLAPDPGELELLLDERVRALYLIHYLGLPQDAARWRRWCDERSLLLIEDAAQAWLAEDAEAVPVGSHGDLATFCLYKTYGVPDGAAVIVRHATLERPREGSGLGLPAGAVAHAHWLAGRSGTVGGLLARRPRQPYSAGEDFALTAPNAGPTAFSVHALARVADRLTASRRRANFAALADAVVGPSPFPRLSERASPFAFPLVTTDKRRSLERLRAASIEPLDLWSVAHPAIGDRFERANELRRSVVALPVHQELRPEDVERIATVAASPRRPVALDIDVVTEMASLRDEWEELVAAGDNVFATWEFNDAWWEHFGAPRPLRLLALRGPGGTLRGVMPTFLWRTRPLRVARLVGHDAGDELGPIVARQHLPAVTRALVTHRDSTWDVLVAEHVRAGDGWSARLGGRVIAREGSPVLRSEGGWERYLQGRSRSLRNQVRRFERRLASRGDLRFRLGDATTLDGDLDTLFALHRARWATAGTTPFARSEPFHRALARRAAARGWLRLWFLEVDGVPRAAWLGFRLGGAESYYQAGRDPAWDRDRVGFVLIAHTIRAALDDGVCEYRFLRGDEPFKYRFSTFDDGIETFAVSSGVSGRAAVTAVTGLRAARRTARAAGTRVSAPERPGGAPPG